MTNFAQSHAKRSDPVTSHEAAESVVGAGAAIKTAIMAYMRQQGRPLAPEQVAKGMDLPLYTVARRMSDLKNEQRLFESDERHRNTTGRHAIRLRLPMPVDGNGQFALFERRAV